MISRALTAKPRKSFKHGYGSDSKSVSISDNEEGGFVGFMEDQPLIHCDDDQLTLREVLRGSVGVIGESRLGITEKVVVLEGRVCALKRFRKVSVRRREFGKRIQRLAAVSHKCNYLVPLTAYLYAKRIKFLLSHYYPMGTLADLLSGISYYYYYYYI